PYCLHLHSPPPHQNSNFFLETRANYWLFCTDLIIQCFSGPQQHSQGYCAMYDICGTRSDRKILNCSFGSPSVKVCSAESHDINCPSFK
ncbi:hypothetical protein Leryth_019813, partial [Lithospermum erythrorhizon]